MLQRRKFDIHVGNGALETYRSFVGANDFCVSQSDKVNCYTKEVDMLVMGLLKPIKKDVESSLQGIGMLRGPPRFASGRNY